MVGGIQEAGGLLLGLRTYEIFAGHWPNQPDLVIGSGELVQTLMRHDLVDAYQLMLHPLVLGSGRRLFRDGTMKTPLKLVDSTTTTKGVLILTYEPAGKDAEG